MIDTLFHPEHVQLAKKEINCIFDLSQRILICVDEMDLGAANKHQKDLEKSLKSLTHLYKLKNN